MLSKILKTLELAVLALSIFGTSAYGALVALGAQGVIPITGDSIVTFIVSSACLWFFWPREAKPPEAEMTTREVALAAAEALVEQRDRLAQKLSCCPVEIEFQGTRVVLTTVGELDDLIASLREHAAREEREAR